jgi:hypothetical protein
VEQKRFLCPGSSSPSSTPLAMSGSKAERYGIMNIICLILEEGEKKAFIFVGVGNSRLIPVFSTMKTALEWTHHLERFFTKGNFNFVAVQPPTKESFEQMYLRTLPVFPNYKFVYEGTSEFRDLQTIVEYGEKMGEAYYWDRKLE